MLLISVDSLRADHLGCYGYPRDTSPALDRLAAQGARFEHAQSPTSWTLPAHVTLLSGRAQHQHGVIAPRDRIPASETLLAEVFAGQGYETIGFFSGPFLDPSFGFDRGFEEYVSCRSAEVEERPVLQMHEASHRDETNPRIRAAFGDWLERRSARPFFAFVHMWDVHFDYIPPEPYASLFDSDYRGPLDGRDIIGEGFPVTATPRDIQYLEALYDGEIRYVDDTIGELLRLLDAAGLREDTLVVVTADHGEEFREHGRKAHKRTLYEESVRVPLVFAGPGVEGGRVIEAPVSLADVAPTLLDLVGLDGLAAANGRSLAPFLRDRELSSRPVFGAFYRRGALVLASLRRGPIKVIHKPAKEWWAQFELDEDPGEKAPGPVDRELRRALRARLREIESALGSEAFDPERASPPLPERVEEALRRLGYVD